MELDRQRGGATDRAKPGRARSRGFYGALVLTAAGLLIYSFVCISIAARNGVAIDPGWSVRSIGDGYRVQQVDSRGAAAGILRPGDRIVAIGGDPRAGVYGPLLAVLRTPPASSYRVDLIREGAAISVVLRMGAVPADAALRNAAPLLLIALLLFGVGSWIGLARPEDHTARLASLSFFLGAMVFTTALMEGYPGWDNRTAAVVAVLATIWRPWHLAVSYDFLSRFPNPVPERLPLRMVRWAIYAIAVAYWLPLNLRVFASAAGLPLIAALRGPAMLRPDAVFIIAYESLTGAGMCLVLVRNYLRQPSIAARRKIRWAGLGLACSIFPFALLTILKLALNLAGIPGKPWFLETIDRAGTLMVGLAPVMVGYAVVKYRVLGIHVVVRRGLQYLLARNVLRLFAFLPLLIILFQAVRQANRSLADLVLHSSWTFYAAVAAALGLSVRYGAQMRLWLDRKFFRVDYEREQILADLIEPIKSAESEEEISLVVVREVERALSVDGIHVLLRNDAAGPYRVAFSYPPREGARIRDFVNAHSSAPPGSSIATLYEHGNMVVSEAPDRQEPNREILMIALAGTDRGVTGYLALGPKRSEEPYTLRDRDLLQAIAGQMAVMYEVLRLKQRIRVEGKMRVEVLGRLERDRIQLLNECPKCGKCYSAEVSACTRDGAELSFTLPVERIIDEKYRLDHRIGRGGMGVVYEARDLRLDREIAVKIMTGELFGNQRALDRFEREARTAAGLKHPNIVAIYDFGRLPAGGAYLVMELIRGRSWRQEVKYGRSIEPARAANWLGQLCAATAAAHSMGIVHRDLKPENVMIAKSDGADRVVVLDFGLAKVHAETPPPEGDLTFAGTLLGTRAYMSPEQRMGEPIDVRTDVYSIGVMAVETLTGISPPRLGATVEWMRQALSGFAAPDSRVTAVLEQAMAELPADRLLSARELGVDLAQAIPVNVTHTGTSSGDVPGETVSLDFRTAEDGK